MEELKLHAEGAQMHIKSLKEAFGSFKQKLLSNSELSEKEKETQLAEAKNVFLKKKKELKELLF